MNMHSNCFQFAQHNQPSPEWCRTSLAYRQRERGFECHSATRNISHIYICNVYIYIIKIQFKFLNVDVFPVDRASRKAMHRLMSHSRSRYSQSGGNLIILKVVVSIDVTAICFFARFFSPHETLHHVESIRRLPWHDFFIYTVVCRLAIFRGIFAYLVCVYNI